VSNKKGPVHIGGRREATVKQCLSSIFFHTMDSFDDSVCNLATSSTTSHAQGVACRGLMGYLLVQIPETLLVRFLGFSAS
jgi:hypothetical protein